MRSLLPARFTVPSRTVFTFSALPISSTFSDLPLNEYADVRDATSLDRPDEPREPGRWLWSELEGLAVRSTTGEELGRVVELYRAGGAEVFVVRGPRGELDVPGVQGIVTDLAPERGELIVDLEALALDARPVEDDEYVRPRDRRPPNPRRARKPKPTSDEAAPTPDEAAPTPDEPAPDAG